MMHSAKKEKKALVSKRTANMLGDTKSTGAVHHSYLHPLLTGPVVRRCKFPALSRMRVLPHPTE